MKSRVIANAADFEGDQGIYSHSDAGSTGVLRYELDIRLGLSMR